LCNQEAECYTFKNIAINDPLYKGRAFMEKYPLISVGLSVLVVVLLPLHQYLISSLGNQDWLNMAFGLPIGVVTACNINIVVNKIRRK